MLLIRISFASYNFNTGNLYNDGEGKAAAV